MRRTKKQLEDEMLKYKVFQENGKWFGFRICPKCGEDIKHSSIKRFIILRTLRNLNISLSLCSSCNKKGSLNHFYGKHHTDKSNAEISKNRIGKACGKNNSMSNPKHRKSVSSALKVKYQSGELDFLKKIQSNNAFKNQANGKLKTAPVSAAEKEIKIQLESIGYYIIPQFNIGSLKYDLLIKDKNILIEYNGDYWHCNPIKYSADYFHKKKQLTASNIWKQDLRKKELAEKSGYKLFIIWEHDYMFNKEIEIQKIIKNI